MAYRGRYIPTYPKKYKGDPSNIIYRSLWERKFMVYCDRNDRILEWGSEEFFIPYRSPLDGKIHRYFPDFYVKVKTKQNTIKKWVVEVKPKAQTRPPRTPRLTSNLRFKICSQLVSRLFVKFILLVLFTRYRNSTTVL